MDPKQQQPPPVAPTAASEAPPLPSTNELKVLLRAFALNTTDPSTLESIQTYCEALFSLDYEIAKVDNANGSLCTHYPPGLIIPVRDKHSDDPRPVNNPEELARLFRTGKFARVRSRFAVPVILHGRTNICRSSTLAKYLEMRTREFIASFFRGTEPDDMGDRGDEVGTDRRRLCDIDLLRTLRVKYICDLMVEGRKCYLGVPVTSSEKVDRKARYSSFSLASTPYPGVEWFKAVTAADTVKWSEAAGVDAHFNVCSELLQTLPSQHVAWGEYRSWDLSALTAHYLQLYLDLIRLKSGNDEGLLVHCISGWDRTPLFISLLRLVLWADGEIHQSLNAQQMLYLTIAYDWMLFGHLLSDRLSQGQEIFLFCFLFLKAFIEKIAPAKHALEAMPSSTASRTPLPPISSSSPSHHHHHQQHSLSHSQSESADHGPDSSHVHNHHHGCRSASTSSAPVFPAAATNDPARPHSVGASVSMSVCVSGDGVGKGSTVSGNSSVCGGRGSVRTPLSPLSARRDTITSTPALSSPSPSATTTTLPIAVPTLSPVPASEPAPSLSTGSPSPLPTSPTTPAAPHLATVSLTPTHTTSALISPPPTHSTTAKGAVSAPTSPSRPLTSADLVAASPSRTRVTGATVRAMARAGPVSVGFAPATLTAASVPPHTPSPSPQPPQHQARAGPDATETAQPLDLATCAPVSRVSVPRTTSPFFSSAEPSPASVVSTATTSDTDAPRAARGPGSSMAGVASEDVGDACNGFSAPIPIPTQRRREEAAGSWQLVSTSLSLNSLTDQRLYTHNSPKTETPPQVPGSSRLASAAEEESISNDVTMHAVPLPALIAAAEPVLVIEGESVGEVDGAGPVSVTISSTAPASPDGRAVAMGASATDRSLLHDMSACVLLHACSANTSGVSDADSSLCVVSLPSGVCSVLSPLSLASAAVSQNDSFTAPSAIRADQSAQLNETVIVGQDEGDERDQGEDERGERQGSEDTVAPATISTSARPVSARTKATHASSSGGHEGGLSCSPGTLLARDLAAAAIEIDNGDSDVPDDVPRPASSQVDSLPPTTSQSSSSGDSDGHPMAPPSPSPSPQLNLKNFAPRLSHQDRAQRLAAVHDLFLPLYRECVQPHAAQHQSLLTRIPFLSSFFKQSPAPTPTPAP